ncbi:MAG: LamG-like jellyroll fold domain-containing protein, partial [Lentisphaerota bacterium]
MLCSKVRFVVLLSCVMFCGQVLKVIAAAPVCTQVSAWLSDDYRFIVGSTEWTPAGNPQESFSSYRWVINGVSQPAHPIGEGLHLHFDQSLLGTEGEQPVLAASPSFDNGQWGKAFTPNAGSVLAYQRSNNLTMSQGTIEMWAALQEDGWSPVYSNAWHPLFHYESANHDSFSIIQASGQGIIYAGGVVSGQWQSAYGEGASMRDWHAGEWHHLACTYSETGRFFRFYVDGSLMADTDQGFFTPPSNNGESFFIGSTEWNSAAYLIDEVRISDVPATSTEIAQHAIRQDPPQSHEIWLPVDTFLPGDSIRFECIPSNGQETGTPCLSDPVVLRGEVLYDPSPESTLLPAGSTSVTLILHSTVSTWCRYSVGTPLGYEDMKAFSLTPGTTHAGTIYGLNPDPNTVNEVYLRCATFPDYLLHLRYRALPSAEPAYPRTANLWGGGSFFDQPLEVCARIDLWLGANFSAQEIRRLRELNPAIRVLTSMDVLGANYDAPAEYYLRDTHGRRIEVWPGFFQLNLTRKDVAAYLARQAANKILENDLMFDGCFFDNVVLTHSWLNHDIHGNTFLLDADNDGLTDDPATFDTAWDAGVRHELAEFHRLMPQALMGCHTVFPYHYAASFPELFNGLSIGFFEQEVLDNRRDFGDLRDLYNFWTQQPLTPHINMIESAPQDQISYGYGYEPWTAIPTATVEFARTYFPNFRFGLTFTLMGDGYFAHEFGDTWHGNNWWYDELNFDLGQPMEIARRIPLGAALSTNLAFNGGFESSINYPWYFWGPTYPNCNATMLRDTSQSTEGAACALITIAATDGLDEHIGLTQCERSLEAGGEYELRFRARSDHSRGITVLAARPGQNLGLFRRVILSTNWTEQSLLFRSTSSCADAQIQFLLGETSGQIRFDDIRLLRRGPELMAREFEHGLVLLNPTRQTQIMDLGPGWNRLEGTQAPLYQWIVDDTDAKFAVTGKYSRDTLDSGEWQTQGPYYHDWGATCVVLSNSAASASWTLDIPAAGTYTLAAWWPGGPQAASRSGRVVYDVVINGRVARTA